MSSDWKEKDGRDGHLNILEMSENSEGEKVHTDEHSLVNNNSNDDGDDGVSTSYPHAMMAPYSSASIPSLELQHSALTCNIPQSYRLAGQLPPRDGHQNSLQLPPTITFQNLNGVHAQMMMDYHSLLMMEYSRSAYPPPVLAETQRQRMDSSTNGGSSAGYGSQYMNGNPEEWQHFKQQRSGNIPSQVEHWDVRNYGSNLVERKEIARDCNARKSGGQMWASAVTNDMKVDGLLGGQESTAAVTIAPTASATLNSNSKVLHQTQEFYDSVPLTTQTPIKFHSPPESLGNYHKMTSEVRNHKSDATKNKKNRSPLLNKLGEDRTSNKIENLKIDRSRRNGACDTKIKNSTPLHEKVGCGKMSQECLLPARSHHDIDSTKSNGQKKTMEKETILIKWANLKNGSILPSQKESEELSKKCNMTKTELIQWLTQYRLERLPRGSEPTKKCDIKCSILREEDVSDIKNVHTKQMNSKRTEHIEEKIRNTKCSVRREKNSSCITNVHIKDINSKKKTFVEDSYRNLREAIEWSMSAQFKSDGKAPYPNAPLAELWVSNTRSNENDKNGKLPKFASWLQTERKGMDCNDTLFGRRWLWDEGHFTDGICHTSVTATKGRPKRSTSNEVIYVPKEYRAYCNCGQKHMNISHDTKTERLSRRSGRGTSSVKMASVLSELANGSLNPHTLISCDEYESGPEFRFLRSDALKNPASDTKSAETNERTKECKDLLEDYDNTMNLDISRIQPFEIKLCPDAAFMTDLHAHLSNSEIIGLLGGDYDEMEKCLYIQAAFPCKSTQRVDSGFTDVEMDPISQVVAADAISRQGMKVVGWYHSHPKFQPDPSVTDIENQGNYQNLFRTSSNNPFVGLIVGTYDSQNPSSQSVMRWFHVAQKERGRTLGKSQSMSKSSMRQRSPKDLVDYPFRLKVTNRNARRFVSDGTDTSKIIKKKKQLTENGLKIRYENDLKALASRLKELTKSKEFSFSNPGKKMKSDNPATITLCHVIEDSNKINEESIPYTQLSENRDGVIKGKRMDLQKNLKMNTNLAGGLTAASIANGSKSADNNSCPKRLLAADVYINSVEQSIVDSAMDLGVLPYTREEQIILASTEVSNDIRAGVIWFAIEREQGLGEGSLTNSSNYNGPLSSEAILNRLFASRVSGDTTIPRYYHKSFFADDDAVIVHAVDAVVYHYSRDCHKVDPFGFTSLLLDESKIERSFLPVHCRRHYKSTVLNSSNTAKMKVGHKITSSLLKWASHMHLGERSGQRHHWKCKLDGVSTENIALTDDVEFVGEVMRLVAARWREARKVDSFKAEGISATKRSPKRKRATRRTEKSRRGRRKKANTFT